MHLLTLVMLNLFSGNIGFFVFLLFHITKKMQVAEICPSERYEPAYLAYLIHMMTDALVMQASMALIAMVLT